MTRGLPYLRWLAVVLTAAVLAGGCSVPGPSVSDVHASLAPPRPVGMQDPATPPSPAAGGGPTDDCNARASLRPPTPFPTPGHMPPGSTMAKIAERGRLILGTDQNTYLFGFRDPFTGKIVGFDVDLAREVAKAIFGDDNEDRVQIVALSSAERIGAIQSGMVDVVAETMTINCERVKQVAFSTVYYEAQQRILVSRDSPIKGLGDLADKRVCATAGSSSIGSFAAKVPSAKLVSVSYWTDCLVVLQQGQAEAITTDDTILAGLAAQDPNVHLVGEGFNAEPYGMAINLSAQDFVRFVNGVLERIRQDGTWKRLYQRWLHDAGPNPPAPLYRD